MALNTSNGTVVTVVNSNAQNIDTVKLSHSELEKLVVERIQGKTGSDTVFEKIMKQI